MRVFSFKGKRLTSGLQVLQEELEVFGTISDSLSRRPCLYPVLLRGATICVHARLEPRCFRLAARICARVLLVVELWLLGMHGAVVDLSSYELFVAVITSEFLKSGKHLPEYVFPGNLFLPQI
jgi:hypothetical protein